MSTHGDLVGRLGQLHNIASRPELNEAYVLIQAYLPEKDRFSVRTLIFPNGNGGVNIAVRLGSIALCTPDHFKDKYPRLHEIQVYSFENAVREQPDGTTLNLKSIQHSQIRPLSVVMEKPHCCVGVRTALSPSGVPNPVTKYFGNVHIAPHSEDDVFEFEDIHFIGSERCTYDVLTCTKGRSITFRRCAFYNVMVMVAGKDPLTAHGLSPAYVAHRVSERQGKPNVVFENCVIDAGVLVKESTGISTGNDGTVTLLNCVIRNCGVGVLNIAGATIILRHCLIENCMNGVGVGEKTRSIDMQHCYVSKNLAPSWFGGYGILLDVSGPALIRDCRVESGQDVGIYLRGKRKHVSRAAISDCYMSGCNYGVAVELGEFAVTIASTVLCNNVRYGLIIYPTALGTVAMNQCSIVENQLENIVNGSPDENMLTIDGVVQDVVQAEFQQPVQLAARRCGQRAGICDINCLNCGRKEESGEKFKKCGKCEDVCYCSRECQKARWKEHKKTCKPQGMVAAVAVDNAIKRFQDGSGSFVELRNTLHMCNPRNK